MFTRVPCEEPDMCVVYTYINLKKKTMLSFSTLLCPAGGLHRYVTSDPHRLAIDGAYLCAPSFTQIHAGNNCFMYPKENSKKNFKNPFHVSTNLRGLTSTFLLKKKISQRLIVTERGVGVHAFFTCVCVCVRLILVGVSKSLYRKYAKIAIWLNGSTRVHFYFGGPLYIFVIWSVLFLYLVLIVFKRDSVFCKHCASHAQVHVLVRSPSAGLQVYWGANAMVK